MKVNKIFLTRISRRLSRAVFSRLIVDAAGNLSNVVFLAGTGRSGTTWVSHFINYRNDYRYMFEPFYPDAVRICGAFKYGRNLWGENNAYGQYLRPENNDRGPLDAAEAILSGHVRNRWIDQYNRRLVSPKRLIKDIRANLLLKWLHAHFPKVRIILLLRHPCAVASSRTKLGWVTYLDKFLAQPALIEDYLSPFKDAIEHARTDFEKHIFAWCIENYVPLQQFRNSEIHLAFYENFCQRPSEEIARMFSFMGESFDGRVFQNVRMPVLAQKDSPIFSGHSLVDGWRKHVSTQQLKRACEIITLFSLDRIYSQESLPNVSRADRLTNTAG